MKTINNVLITGAAGGIGSSLVQLLLNEGARLILVDKNEKKLGELYDGLLRRFTPRNDDPDDILEKLKDKISVYTVDLSSRESLYEFVEQIKDRDIDVLVNNAGITTHASFINMSPVDIDSVININLKSVILLTHCLLPQLKKNKQAHIVNVASAAGLAAPGGLCIYSTSKFGVVGFSESLRAELKGHNIGVSVICPSFVKTNIIYNSRKSSKSFDEELRLKKLDQMVQKQGVTPEKVALKIIKAIKKNKARVVVGKKAKCILLLNKIFPKITEYINNLNYKKMIKKGLIQ